jgi:RNA polymerase sigma factor (sigma-70 family)
MRDDEAGAVANGDLRPGDERERFDELFVGMLPELHPRLLGLVRTRDAAQDLVQDLYVRISQESRAQRLVRHPNPGGYLYLTAVNIVRDSWRQSRRLRAALDRIGPDCPQGSDGGLAELESRLDLWAVLRCLSRKESLAVFLVDISGYSLQEAACILGIRKATVQHNRDRALVRLRQACLQGRLAAPAGAGPAGAGPAAAAAAGVPGPAGEVAR